ncbi:MAG: hypothetical protein GX221_01035 [Candidatus Riflebacteria bacterium]|nr:hypothetical protein [Candidatus Riflebacteria bacterium]
MTGETSHLRRDMRVAYKRLKANPELDTVTYENALAFLVYLSIFNAQKKYASTLLCLQAFFDLQTENLKKQLKQKLDGALKYVEAMKFSKAEAEAWVNNVKEQNEKTLSNFMEQYKINLKLFDCKINKDNKIVCDYTYLREVVEKLRNIKIKDQTIEIFPVEEIRIIYSKLGITKYADKYLNDFDFVSNGTYYHANKPLGTLISEDSTYETDVIKVKNRGGLAVLESGIVNMGLTPANGENEIKKYFQEVLNSELDIPELQANDKVFEFIGGGALLICNGQPVSGLELYEKQKFDQGTENENGFESSQLQREAPRIMFAKYNEILFFIYTEIPPKKIQKILKDEGFSDLICFDGGNAFYLKSKIDNISTKEVANPSGFAVRVMKYEE